MVIKTDTCFFSELKIFPGHGMRFVRKDGKLLAFLNQKCRSLYFQKKKAQRLTWSQQWRARHKKGRVETVQKRAKKRAAKVFKSIQGLDLESLRQKRNAETDARKAARDAKVREAKEQKRKNKAEKKKVDKATKKSRKATQAAGFVKVTKQRKNLNRR